MRTMGAGSRAQANRIEAPSPWLLLWELELSSIERVYLVNNEEGFTFEGNTYRPFPVTLEVLEETLGGDIPGLNLVVSNISREFSGFLQHRQGLLDRTVYLRIVSASHPEEPALRHRFTIRSSSATESEATFRLSQVPFADIDIPYRKFHRSSCHHAFRGEACGWAFPSLPPGVQDSTSCSKRLDGPNGCVAHGLMYEAAGQPSKWPARFGGFPGIPRRRT